MAQKQTYRVLREMQGKHDYAVGDTRQLTADEAAHLVKLGVLQLVGPKPKGKAAPKPQNKAAPALSNKGDA